MSIGTLKTTMKRLAFAICPDSALKVMSIRSRRLIEKQVEEMGLAALARRIASITDGRVDRGPFAGMRLDYDALPVHGAPKFVGAYEEELHPIIERLIELAPLTVLDVGTAEGFYVVGMALRIPTATIFAAEADPKALRATIRNARLNKVADRVRPVGIIHPGSFSRYVTRGGAVIMDCEGAEFSLLDPVKDPVLATCHILVEVHPEFGTVEEIARRFQHTHRICVVQPCARIISSADELRFGPHASRAFDERTGTKAWLYMELLVAPETKKKLPFFASLLV